MKPQKDKNCTINKLWTKDVKQYIRKEVAFHADLKMNQVEMTLNKRSNLVFKFGIQIYSSLL